MTSLKCEFHDIRVSQTIIIFGYFLNLRNRKIGIQFFSGKKCLVYFIHIINTEGKTYKKCEFRDIGVSQTIIIFGYFLNLRNRKIGTKLFFRKKVFDFIIRRDVKIWLKTDRYSPKLRYYTLFLIRKWRKSTLYPIVLNFFSYHFLYPKKSSIFLIFITAEFFYTFHFLNFLFLLLSTL